MSIPAPYQLLTGKDIKCPLYKVLSPDMTHNNFTYRKGLNVLEEKFYPADECKGGGLYASWYPWKFFDYGTQIAEVTLPDNARVWTMRDKLKVDRMILGKPVPIAHVNINWSLIIKQNACNLMYIEMEKQTPELCMAAVTQNGMTLEHVQSQTPELCMTAVMQQGMALKFVKNQTPDICEAAVRNEGLALQYVHIQTPDLCMTAVKGNGLAITFVHNQTPDICETAIENTSSAIGFVHDQTPNLCELSIKSGWWNLRYITQQTPELCMMAIRQDARALEYVSPTLYESVVQYCRREKINPVVNV